MFFSVTRLTLQVFRREDACSESQILKTSWNGYSVPCSGGATSPGSAQVKELCFFLAGGALLRYVRGDD